MRRIAVIASIATLLPIAAALAAPLAKTDRMFVRRAALGGMTEVQEGQAAVTSASSADVKAFAQKMVDAHTANNQQLMQIAQSKGMTVPSTLDKHHTAQLDALTKSSGTDFDKTYVQDQIRDHRMIEKVMQNEIDNGQDADLKSFATQTLPVVKEHLAMAQKLKS